jgi:hypothetical protein
LQIIDRHKEDELEVYLEPGDRLVWYGIPKQGILFSKSDIFLVPFSLLWGGFAILWELLAISSDAPLIFMLWGIPFVLLGIYMIIGRFIVNALIRKKTLYGFTKKRIVVKTGLRGNSIRLGDMNNLAGIKMKLTKDGSGSIIFSFHSKLTEVLSDKNGVKRTIIIFKDIHDVKFVYEKLMQVKNDPT